VRDRVAAIMSPPVLRWHCDLAGKGNCNTLQLTVTRGNTLQLTVIRCNTV